MLSLLKNKKIHIVGIGGIGMSAIAEILVSYGCSITGSDMSGGGNINKLEKMGVKVFIGHNGSNIKDCELLVHSSAVKSDNPEVSAALEQGVPVLRRSQILSDIMKLKNGVAIAGTHGKTTTTSLVATILKSAGFDPTYIIGGIVKNLSGHAHVGEGDLFVVEADESDGTFLNLSPVVAGITNIDFDHLDFYKSEENLIRAFEEFANIVPFFGKMWLNYDDPFSRKISGLIKKPFGLISTTENKEIDFSISSVEEELGKISFDLLHFGENAGRVTLRLNGQHNIQNCLIAAGICHELGLSFKQIIDGVSQFEGVGRRLEILKDVGDSLVIDDYGHHPTEVKATISSVSKMKKDRELVVIFEPHRFSRTYNCWNDFVSSFEAADKVFMLPIYPANEEPIEGITSERLASEINNNGQVECLAIDSMDEIISNQGRNQIILTMGAGKIGNKVRELVIR